ncbi:hypothetical protein Tco_1429988 [Tanacetum coccineum]
MHHCHLYSKHIIKPSIARNHKTHTHTQIHPSPETISLCRACLKPKKESPGAAAVVVEEVEEEEVDEEQQTNTDQVDSSRQIRQVQSTESYKHRDEREGSGRQADMQTGRHADRQTGRAADSDSSRFKQRIQTANSDK